jgi:anti-anti-sigma factor
MKITIWGARGSIPSPLTPREVEEKICYAILGLPNIDTNDLEAIRAYVGTLPPLIRGTAGGNTSCVEIWTGGETLIIDAGTGLRELGMALMSGPCGRGKGRLHLFLSHPHWDHIQGFPFFVPAFIPGNHISIYGVHDIEAAFEDQQCPVNFPVSLSQMEAEIDFVPLEVGQPFSIGQTRVNTIRNTHPGDSYGYRFEDQHNVLVYASDAEFKQLDEAAVKAHVEFFRNADVLIFDAQYTLVEGWQKVDWGHSSALIGIELARAAGVKTLVLFHHDPTYSDTELRRIRSNAVTFQNDDPSLPHCEVVVAYEGMMMDLAPPGAVGLRLLPEEEAAVLTPTHVFDVYGADELGQQLARLADQESLATPIIDLSQVETLTTASLKSLVLLRRESERAPLILAAPSRRVRQVIELGGFSDYFAVYPSVEDALAAVQVREELSLPGQVVKGRYQIEDKVAEGWLGIVLKATDLLRDRSVALKVLSPVFSQETIERFMRQAEQVVALGHPNIVQAIAWDEDRGHVFVAEELMTGQMLHDLLAESGASFSGERALDIASDITRALEYAHSRGVIHGDLKLRNIFLTEDGDGARPRAKVAGFGLGRLEEGRNLRQAPLLYLDPAYLAPEQILGQMLDARTDLYGLGVVLYQMFTGRPPFEGADREVMEAHLRQAPRPPRELNPGLSLPLEHVVLKLLAKNPNDRYASVQQVRRVLSGVAVGEEETARQRELVGREVSMQALQECWEEARAGRGQIALVTGEPGIGKTILAQQAAVQSQPPVLLVGRCREVQGEPAYDLFAQILQAYFATVPPELQDEEARHLLSNLLRLVPEIRHMVPDLPEPPPLEPQQEQLRLMTSLTRFVEHATQERPWFLILDDLQWADPSSLELLRHLGRNLSRMALLVIGTYRDVEVARGHPLQEAVRDLSALDGYHHIPLDRLDQAGVGRLLTNLWEQPVPEALTERIYRHTGGNPFYVEEVAKGLVDDGLVALEEGLWHFPAPEELRLPESVREAVWRRVEHLGPDTQGVLRQAAVLGQIFRFDDLREMGGLSEWEALEHLDVALERQLVEEVGGDTQLRFRHAGIQSALYDDLGPVRRRLLHRQAARALERRAGPDPARLAGELAHHLGQAGDYEPAVGYAVEAGRQAQAAYANEDAHLWYSRALDMVEQLGPERASEFQPLRLAAHESLGQVLALLGRYDEALAHYAEARALLEAETESPEQARHLADLCRQTADVHERRSEYDVAFEWLERGLGYLDEDKSAIEAARIYLMGGGVYRRQGKNDEAVDWCQRSLAIASEIEARESQKVVAHAHYLLGGLFVRRGELSRAVQLCRESVELYGQIDDLIGQANAYNNLAIAYLDQGDWTRASSMHRESLAIRRKVGDIYGELVSANNLAEIHLNQGEWDQAYDLYEWSHATCKQSGVLWGEAITKSNLAQVHICRENWSEARDCLSRSQAIFAQIGSEEYLPELERRWGELYLKTGELDQALAHIERSIELAIEQGNPLEEGKSRRMLGQVHLARGERGPAEAALRQSLQILTDLNSEYEVARTRLVLARLAAKTDSISEEARSYLALAIDTFERLGAKADLVAARELEGRFV